MLEGSLALLGNAVFRLNAWRFSEYFGKACTQMLSTVWQASSLMALTKLSIVRMIIKTRADYALPLQTPAPRQPPYMTGRLKYFQANWREYERPMDFSIPIAEGHRRYLRLRFIFNNLLYEFQCLPFGLLTALRRFTKVLRPAIALLRQQVLYE